VVTQEQVLSLFPVTTLHGSKLKAAMHTASAVEPAVETIVTKVGKTAATMRDAQPTYLEVAMQHSLSVQVVHGASHTQRQTQHCGVVRAPSGGIMQQT
jgi:hypothetical protein